MQIYHRTQNNLKQRNKPTLLDGDTDCIMQEDDDPKFDPALAEEVSLLRVYIKKQKFT